MLLQIILAIAVTIGLIVNPILSPPETNKGKIFASVGACIGAVLIAAIFYFQGYTDMLAECRQMLGL